MGSTLWLDVLGAEIRREPVNGYQTRWIEAGDGPPLILLHGLSGHAETWSKNITKFAESFHVYALDMLGHGMSEKPTIDYSIAVLAQHVMSFMDAREITRANLIGQSLGGWVAAAIAINHPERIIAWVSATGAGLQLTDDGEEMTRSIGAKVRDATNKALASPTLGSVRERLEWLMFDKSIVTDELVAVRHHMYNQADFAAIAPRIIDSVTASVDMNEMLTRDKLATVTRPTLIFWTRNNPTMQWDVGKTASEVIPNAEFYLMEEAGHWPQYEKPEEFHAVVIPFLLKANG
jgi:pimeloyl-ACP methyl ester carboxylesterase